MSFTANEFWSLVKEIPELPRMMHMYEFLGLDHVSGGVPPWVIGSAFNPEILEREISFIEVLSQADLRKDRAEERRKRGLDQPQVIVSCRCYWHYAEACGDVVCAEPFSGCEHLDLPGEMHNGFSSFIQEMKNENNNVDAIVFQYFLGTPSVPKEENFNTWYRDQMRARKPTGVNIGYEVFLFKKSK